MKTLKAMLALFLLFSQVWAVNFGHFPAVESTGEQGEWYEEILQLSLAHAVSCGRGIYIVQIDSGVYASHPDLKGHLLLDLAYSFGDNSTDVSDYFGHGTATAGIIALVAPCSKIIPLKINRGGEGWFTSEPVKKALKYALELSKRYPQVKVVNMSIVLSEEDEDIEKIINELTERGVVVVAAAGNESDDKVSFPASAPNAIAVSAIDSGYEIVASSNHGNKVFISAPGAWIKVPSIFGGYTYMSGTSMAAAFVSGIAALVAEKNPNDLKLWLARGSIDTGKPGYDRFYGFGIASALYSTVASLSESLPVFPEKVNLRAGESCKIYYSSPEKVLVFSMNPEIASAKVTSQYTVEITGHTLGNTDVYLLTPDPLAVSRVEVTVSLSPAGHINSFVYPYKLTQSGIFCLFLKSTEARSSVLTYKKTRETPKGFETSQWDFQVEVPYGDHMWCWEFDPENKGIGEILMLLPDLSFSRAIFSR